MESSSIRASVCFLLMAVLFFGTVLWAHASFSHHIILYVDGQASIDTMTTVQKTELVLKYTPASVQTSKEWGEATAAQKWTYFKEKVMPPELNRRMADQGVMPVLRGLNDKLELIDEYWKLASDGTRYVFLLHVSWDKKFAPIKAWMDKQTGIRYWHGETMLDALKDLWADRADKTARGVIKYIVKVPVTVGKVQKMMTIRDAEAYLKRAVTAEEVVAAFKDHSTKMAPIEVWTGGN